jgi:hypothetical protein
MYVMYEIRRGVPLSHPAPEPDPVAEEIEAEPDIEIGD